MTLQQLLAKFSQGINWNALFYAIYKLLFTLLSFTLFVRLTTQDFSTWANINGVIFFVLLVLDLGLRKSIPRYAPEFAKNRKSHKRFIGYLILAQVCLLTVATPLFIYCSDYLATLLHLSANKTFFYIGSAIFFIEGIISLLRLIYHAHFWNKQFNMLTTVMLLAEMLANAVIIAVSNDSSRILTGILITKILADVTITIISLGMLNKLYKDQAYPGDQTIDFGQTVKAFIKHSAIMGCNNALKSLTERNFLVLFFTYLVGATQANLFKIANDGALFFYRIILKTIGTTDTALLSHIETSPAKQRALSFAFKKLTQQIITICIPVTTLAVLITLKGRLLFELPFIGTFFRLAFAGKKIFDNNFVFYSFCIMTTGYLLETILSPYERILEIKQRYIALLQAYSPYIVMLLCLFFCNFVYSFGLLKTIAIIQATRLISALLMAYLAKKYYPLQFPIAYTLSLLAINTAIVSLFALLL